MFKAIQELLQQVFRVGSKPGVPVTETKDVMNKLLNLQKKFDELDPNDGAGAADLSDEFRQVEIDVKNLEFGSPFDSFTETQKRRGVGQFIPQNLKEEMKLQLMLTELARKTGVSVDETKRILIDKATKSRTPAEKLDGISNDDASLLAYIEKQMGNETNLMSDIIENAKLPNQELNAIRELAEESKEKARKIIETESPPDEFFGRTVDIDELMKAEDQINRLSEPTGNIADEINDAVRATEIKNEDLAKLEDKMSDPKNFSKSVDELMQEVMDEKVSPIRPEKKATGGRIGFQDGSDFKGGPKIGRRAFLGGLGAGIASLFIPRGAAKVATTAAKAAPEIAAQGMPNWFPLLVNKIKKQGKQTNVATGGRNPTNTYKLKSPDGDEYYLYEDMVSGNMEITTRGDDFQQVSFEYVPATDVVRPGGKVIKEDSEFYASEFQKGEFQDFENPADSIDDLKLGISNIEEFAKAGTKTPAERLDEIAAEFKKASTKEEFATGGRVGYNNGGGVGTLFKEKRA